MNEKPNAAPVFPGMRDRSDGEVRPAYAIKDDLPDSETRESVEAIMALADEYAQEYMTVCLQEGEGFEAEAALRAAVERVIQERDEARTKRALWNHRALVARNDCERAEQERDDALAALNAPSGYICISRAVHDTRLEAALTAQKEAAALRVDAERYRWLRMQHWYDSKLCVTVYPKQSLKLGGATISEHQLDQEIDAQLKEANERREETS